MGDADPQCAATFRVLALGLLGMDGCGSSVSISLHGDFPNAAPSNFAVYRCFDCAVIRVYDAAGNVIETHEHAEEFKDW